MASIKDEGGETTHWIRRTRIACAALLAALLPWFDASADEFPLTVELRTGRTAEFGTIFVDEETDGSLLFEIQLDPSVAGERADIHQLYFNLLGSHDELMLVTEDDVPRPYGLRRAERMRLGSGPRFDWRIDFGVGRAGRWMRDRSGREHSNQWGNGILQSARFRLMANRPLRIGDLLPLSATRSGLVMNTAVFLKHAGPKGSMVGGIYDPASAPPEPQPEPQPEPSTEPDPTPAPGECSWAFDPATGLQILFCN